MAPNGLMKDSSAHFLSERNLEREKTNRDRRWHSATAREAVGASDDAGGLPKGRVGPKVADRSAIVAVRSRSERRLSASRIPIHRCDRALISIIAFACLEQFVLILTFLHGKSKLFV